MKNQKRAIVIVLVGICCFIFADSWNFIPGRMVYKFGDVKIVQIIAAKDPTPCPDFIIDFYVGKELKAKYRNVYAQAVFQSPDGNYFVGLSNSGWPGTAYVVFDRKGNLLREAKHDFLDFVQYCRYSLFIDRTWVNIENPELRFFEGSLGTNIQVTGCNGKKYNLLNRGVWGEGKFFYSKKDSLDNRYNNIVNE